MLARQGHRVIMPYLRGYGATRFHSAATLRNGQPAALATHAVALMDALGLRNAIVAGCDWRARNADIVTALWPERVTGLVAVSGYLISSQASGVQPLAPEAELQWWYQFCFATERGRLGYEKYRRAFARLDVESGHAQMALRRCDLCALGRGFRQSRSRRDRRSQLSLAPRAWPRARRDTTKSNAGSPQVPRSRCRQSRWRQTPTARRTCRRAPILQAKYEHRRLSGGIGHNLPQEAPEAFVKAVVDVARM
jgi:pimeloyl-ACP methyl ester carboxylesterase